MNPPPRGGGLVARALLLALLTALSGALVMTLALRPEVAQALQRMGWSIGYEARLGVATLLTLLIGGALAAALFGGAEREIRVALATLAESEEPAAGADGLTALTGALTEWRQRVRVAEASRERLEAAARAMTETLDAAAREIGGAEPDGPGGTTARLPVEYEDETLRRLAAAGQETTAAARRVRLTLVTLLARVAEDMTDVGEALGPVQETLVGMGRVIEDLVATYPALPALAALRAALTDCGADVARARQAAELVERELNAVRRRMGGGTLERLTARDLVTRDDGQTPERME